MPQMMPMNWMMMYPLLTSIMLILLINTFSIISITPKNNMYPNKKMNKYNWVW